MQVTACGVLLLLFAGTAAMGSSFPPLVEEGEKLGDVEALVNEIGRRSLTNEIAFSPDGKTLAAASDDRTVRLWDVASGEATRRLEGHASEVRSVAFSPDGKTLASASDDRTVRLWTAASGKTIRRLEGHASEVRSVTFSPDGTTLASASDDGTVRLWSVASGETIERLVGHASEVRSVAFNPDGKTLASASDDGTVRLWDVASGETMERLEGHAHGVFSVAFSPDGTILASASSDQTVRLWDVASGEMMKRLEVHGLFVRSVAFSPDGKTLASASDDVRLWDVASGEMVERLEVHASKVLSVAYSPDGKTLASASDDRAVQLWTVTSGEPMERLEGHASEIRSVVFSPDGKTLASASDDRAVRLWDVASGEAMKYLEGHTSGVRSLAFSPGGENLVSASDDGTVRLWDVASGEMIRRLGVHDSEVRFVAFSPDGKTLVSASDDGAVRLWDVTSGEAIQRLEVHEFAVFSVAISPDGKTLASASDDRAVQLWDIASGETIKRLEGHEDWVLSMAFSPDGKTLASASSDGAVRLWDVASGETIKRLKGHEAWVFSMAFSPDGKTFASASSDGAVRLWDVASGKTIKRLEGHAHPVFSVAFSPDGRTLASGSTEIHLSSRSEAFATSRILFGGRRGTWLSCDLDGTCLRHDDGTLVVRRKSDGRIVPVPPDVEAMNPELEILGAPIGIETLDGRSTELILKVRNAGRHRSFRIRLRRVTVSPDDPLVVALPPAHALLKPGEVAELPCRISTLSTHDDPTAQTSTLSFEVTSLHGEPLAVPSIAVHGKVSSPSVASIHWTDMSDAPTFVVTLINEGEQDLASVRVDASVDGLAQALPSVEHASPIEPGASFQVPFTVPSFQPDESTRVTIKVTKAEFPVHVWTFSDQPIAVAGPNVALVAALATLLFATVCFLALFSHPLVQQLSKEPAALRTRPPSELHRARWLLSLTGRLSSILAGAKVERVWLNDAIAFFDDSDPASRFRRLAERLGLESDPVGDRAGIENGFRVLPVGPLFPLGVERCLVHQPPPGRPAADVCNRLRQRPETLDQITLILAADPAAQDELHRIVAPDRSHLLVAPSGAELTELLLASDPLEQLARTVASQVKLVRVSPYQTGGGIHKEAGFFGRDEHLAQILSRESINYLVVGGRQVGKTSLLNAVERRAQADQSFDVRYLALSGDDLTGGLARALSLRRGAGLERVLTQLRQKGGRTLFLIDEADDFVRSPGSREVLAQLRSLSEEGRCHFILAGFWELYAAAILDYHSPLKNFGKTLRIDALEEYACRQLAVKPMESMGLRYEGREIVERLVHETGRRANLIAIACNEILQGLDAGERTISPEVVDAALSSFAIDEALEGWAWLGREEDDDDSRLDRVIIYATIERDGFTLTDLFEVLDGHGVRAKPRRVERSLKRLELAYVVKRSGPVYTYPVPLFVRQVRERGPKTLLARELRGLA